MKTLKPKYLVVNMTNYGYGIEIGGVYNTRDRAEKRLKYCEENISTSEDDSWRIMVSYSHNIKDNGTD